MGGHKHHSRTNLVLISSVVGGIVAMIGFLGSVASLISLFDTSGKFKEAVLSFGLDVRWPAVLLTVSMICSVVLFGISANLAWHFVLRRNAARKCAKRFHALFHFGRDKSAEIFRLLASNRGLSPLRAGEAKAIIVQHLSDVVEETKRIFEEITRSPCDVTLKLVYPPNTVGRGGSSRTAQISDLRVRDLIRDAVSRRDRGLNGDYQCILNSAYNNILQQKGPNYYYMSNNLRKEDPPFANPRTDWNQHYNACLVVPVQIGPSGIPNPQASAVRHIVGFLCVDNKKGGFDERICFNVLCGIADYLFVYLYLYYELYTHRKPTGDNHESQE